MGRARRNACRLCMKPTNRGESTTINNLPKTFAHILEEISGFKFSEADGLHMTVCFKCRDFLQAMEHHSQYPRSNKISGAGKKKVRRLMDKGFSAAEAIEKVIAEKRARDLLAGTGLPAQGAPVQAPRNAPNANIGVPVDNNKVRMSGAQRKKLQKLLAGGADPIQARELIMASSLASRVAAGANPLPQRSVAPRGAVEKGVVQRGGPGQRALGQNAVVQRGAVRRAPGLKVPPQVNAPQNGAPQRTRKVLPDKAPLRKVSPQKSANGAALKAPGQKVVQKGPVSSQQKPQPNPAGGRNQNTVRRVGANVNPRRNDRPAPYNNRGNNNQQQIQQNGNFNQQQQQQQPPCPLEVGIVPINFPNVQLDDMKLDALKEAITNEILKIPQGGPLIRFLGTSSQNGWLKLICADQLSYNWLSMLVSRWERAGVRLVDGNALPQPVVLSFYLPGDFRSPEEILNILERQNSSLNTSQWRILNRETDSNGQSITVCVDEPSFQALQSRDFIIFLGLGVVELKPRRFPSDGDSFTNVTNVSVQGRQGNNNNNNRSNSGGNNNSKGYSMGSGGGGMGNNYQNRLNNSGGGGSFQRQGMGQGQGYQRAGHQSQRSW